MTAPAPAFSPADPPIAKTQSAAPISASATASSIPAPHPPPPPSARAARASRSTASDQQPFLPPPISATMLRGSLASPNATIVTSTPNSTPTVLRAPKCFPAIPNKIPTNPPKTIPSGSIHAHVRHDLRCSSIIICFGNSSGEILHIRSLGISIRTPAPVSTLPTGARSAQRRYVTPASPVVRRVFRHALTRTLVPIFSDHTVHPRPSGVVASATTPPPINTSAYSPPSPPDSQKNNEAHQSHDHAPHPSTASPSPPPTDNTASP